MPRVLTPLRYPGGKTSIYIDVLRIIKKNNIENFTYVEPFAGGFGIGINLLLNGVTNSLIINDIDYSLYSFWFSIINYTDAICELIWDTPINIEQWHIQKHIFENKQDYNVLENGFATFFLNRTNRSGILKAGPIGGYKQNGNYLIDCRFNKKDLINKIKTISQHKNNIEIYNLDAIDLIQNVLLNRKDKLFINFDPPYVERGGELYINYFKEKDHRRLANIIKSNLNEIDWMITYDNHELIKKLYSDYFITDFTLRYSAQSKRKGSELLILSQSLKY